MSAALRGARAAGLARWIGGFAALCLCAQAFAGEGLGRLFFTPEERARLDRQRHEAASPAPAARVGATVRVSGVVVRSGGRGTVWLNGRPFDAEAPGSASGPRVRRQVPARVELDSADGRTLHAQVGESVELATGRRRSLLGRGRIEVSPATPAPRR
ncbi:MAG: hypothetical protein Fur0039_10390 [Rhodocyclaceae bacterium]